MLLILHKKPYLNDLENLIMENLISMMMGEVIGTQTLFSNENVE